MLAWFCSSEREEQEAFEEEMKGMRLYTLIRHAFAAPTDLGVLKQQRASPDGKGTVLCGARLPLLRVTVEAWERLGGERVTGAAGIGSCLQYEADGYTTNLRNYVKRALPRHVRRFVATVVEWFLLTGDIVATSERLSLPERRQQLKEAETAMKLQVKVDEKARQAEVREAKQKKDYEAGEIYRVAKEERDRRVRKWQLELARRKEVWDALRLVWRKVKDAAAMVWRRRQRRKTEGEDMALQALEKLWEEHRLPPIVKDIITRFWMLDDAVWNAVRDNQGKCTHSHCLGKLSGPRCPNPRPVFDIALNVCVCLARPPCPCAQSFPCLRLLS